MIEPMKLMMTKRLAQAVLWLALALMATLTFIGCGTPNGGRDSAPPLKNPGGADPNVFRPDDQVIIYFVGTEAPDAFQDRIKEDGTISLPLIGLVQAAGLTPKQLQDSIQAKYVPDYYLRLSVTVRREERYFYVGGEVRLPSRYNYVGETTVLKAISTAGGFTDFASKKSVQVSRANGRQVTVDCTEAQQDPSKDIPIYPGDRINVPRRIL